MAKPDLGEKHTCVSCGTRFFDLGKDPCNLPELRHRAAGRTAEAETGGAAARGEPKKL